MFFCRFCVLRIHRICLHIIVNHFSVILFFLLNVIYSISHIRVAKFEHTGVIKMRSVLFSCEKVAAKEAVVLFLGSFGTVLGCRKCCRTACRAARALRATAHFDRSERIKMLSFYLRDTGKKVFELCIVCSLRMTCVFVNAKLLLVLHVLQ